jgi:hypothetical protein
VNLAKQLQELKKLNLDPATEARLREKLRRKSMWNQPKLLSSGWTKKLINELLGEPDEIRRFLSRGPGTRGRSISITPIGCVSRNSIPIFGPGRINGRDRFISSGWTAKPSPGR